MFSTKSFQLFTHKSSISLLEGRSSRSYLSLGKWTAIK
jgi:hypothetical protein